MTYLLLNIAFCLTLVLLLPAIRHVRRKPLAWTIAIVCLLTAIFDPMLIALGMFGYNDQALLGLKLLGVPIEDFFYPVYAVLVTAALWEKLGDGDADNR